MKIYNIFQYAKLGDLPIEIPGVAARGASLLSNGKLGADMIYLEPNQAFPTHTHPGDHLLLVVQGTGNVTVEGTVYNTSPGDLYMINGGSLHAVGAGAEGLHLLSFGAPHIPLDDPRRMRIIEQ